MKKGSDPPRAAPPTSVAGTSLLAPTQADFRRLQTPPSPLTSHGSEAALQKQPGCQYQDLNFIDAGYW